MNKSPVDEIVNDTDNLISFLRKKVKEKDEALKLAREALEPIRRNYEDGTYAMICPICHAMLDEDESNHHKNCKAYEAIKAIDKAIGGGEK